MQVVRESMTIVYYDRSPVNEIIMEVMLGDGILDREEGSAPCAVRMISLRLYVFQYLHPSYR